MRTVGYGHKIPCGFSYTHGPQQLSSDRNRRRTPKSLPLLAKKVRPNSSNLCDDPEKSTHNSPNTSEFGRNYFLPQITRRLHSTFVLSVIWTRRLHQNCQKLSSTRRLYFAPFFSKPKSTRRLHFHNKTQIKKSNQNFRTSPSK